MKHPSLFFFILQLKMKTYKPTFPNFYFILITLFIPFCLFVCLCVTQVTQNTLLLCAIASTSQFCILMVVLLLSLTLADAKSHFMSLQNTQQVFAQCQMSPFIQLKLHVRLSETVGNSRSVRTAKQQKMAKIFCSQFRVIRVTLTYITEFTDGEWS